MIGVKMDISLRVFTLVGHNVLNPIWEYVPIHKNIKNKKIIGFLRALPYMGARRQCLRLDSQAVNDLPLRFSNPEGILSHLVVNGQGLTRCHRYSYEGTCSH